MTTEDALVDVDAVILSIPLNRILGIALLVARLPDETMRSTPPIIIRSAMKRWTPSSEDTLMSSFSGEVRS